MNINSGDLNIENTNNKKIKSFDDILSKIRKESFFERDKGFRFEKLMKKYLQVEPQYNNVLSKVWLWNEFPFRKDFSGKDTGIDLVAQTVDGDYWAIQCKCYKENERIEKSGVDSFLSTSGKGFIDEFGRNQQFVQRLWISTTNNWNSEAEKTIKNQSIPFNRISLTDLRNTFDYIDWNELVNGSDKNVLKNKKTPREHQIMAINNFHEHFKIADRGKLIMACGTGKTYTSLKIAENETDGKGVILFLVPSIALLGQTLREWSVQADKAIYPICICSDSTIGREEDEDDSVVDLVLPASTNIKSIIKQFEVAKENRKGMLVVFSTYQSIDVISKVQKELNKNQKDNCLFDLIICDEAHRTTGVILKDKEKDKYDEKSFTKVHDNKWVEAKKRLYMTATPRLYREDAKKKAEKSDVLLCSMDDEKIYGREVYRIGFGEAVNRELLSDYKVLVLTLKEEQISTISKSIIESNMDDKEITIDDVSKLIGCINALSKRVIDADKEFNDDKSPMRNAVAFCQNINASKLITKMFKEHKGTYYNSLPQNERELLVGVEAKHIDGKMGASQRDELLTWLKDAPKNSKECRILTNVKCLSEGVDVPSLDAVMFLAAKNSQVDVVQSVGRVMRKVPNKNYGYIVIPIMIPEGIEPEEALNDNKRYAVIWSVLNALRAHDDRFDAEINTINLKNNKNGKIKVIGVKDSNLNNYDNLNEVDKQLTFQLDEIQELQNVIYAKMVQKVGSKGYFTQLCDQWSSNVGVIAQKYEDRIKNIIKIDVESKNIFDTFLEWLKNDINPSISKEETIRMLTQHLITKPVFEALFKNYPFIKNNPISKSLEGIVKKIEQQIKDEESEKILSRIYKSVEDMNIDNVDGQQKMIIKLYNDFFRKVFTKKDEQLGVAYTPIEVVDFINNSVNDILYKEFNKTLSMEGVHIIDPFTGTGTFITRLLQSGLIKKENLKKKYENEIFANEIILLAYYVASVNIENTYHDLIGENKEYKNFEGISLTDTFQIYEDMLKIKDGEKNMPLMQHFDEIYLEKNNLLKENSYRIKKQKKTNIQVIIGNPPYSKNNGDNNCTYPKLESRMTETYFNKKILFDTKKTSSNTYMKAFRLATDRIEDFGIISFICPNEILYTDSYRAVRKCLCEDFSDIYIIDLKGKGGSFIQKKDREINGENIFGQDCTLGISIYLLVKNKKKKNNNSIHYYSIGDGLSREDKLERLKKIGSMINIKFDDILMDEYYDWFNKRNKNSIFYKDAYIPINSFFLENFPGIVTNREAWCWNFSHKKLEENIKKTINYYNEQRVEMSENKSIFKLKDDPTKCKWSRDLEKKLFNNKIIKEEKNSYKIGFKCPFSKENLYYNNDLNERPSKYNKIYDNNTKNMCILIPEKNSNEFSCFIVNTYPYAHVLQKAKYFPLYFDNLNNISDYIFNLIKEKYGKTNNINKEDVFYYIYGLLHSNDYRRKFSQDLKKTLPRIPLVDDYGDFLLFSQSGKELANLHLNYETVPSYPNVKVIGEEKEDFYVDKLTFAKKDKKDDKTTIIYNSSIRITNIPLDAYNYIINGRSAIENVMSKYKITIDIGEKSSNSGIKNDPNDWGKEHGNPRYILDLLLSIINVSMKTNEIVNKLPKLNLK